MWELTEQHCQRIPVAKSPEVLITTTAYRRNVEQDRAWLKEMQLQYGRIWFWSQMYDDLEYTRMLIGDTFAIIPPNLAAYDKFLENNDVDFIGTRLHGGIRALRKKRRALIIEVDNRATEIAKDTNLTTVKRHDIDAIREWINNPKPVEVRLPADEIARWRGQFV